MKKKRMLIVLLLAVLTGGLAGFLALKQMTTQGVAMPAKETSGRIRLAVAARDMAQGSILRTEDVRLIDWPGEVLPVGYAGSVAELVGRGLIGPLKTNEPILSSKLADREAGGGLPILIPEGMRAISVRVDEVVQVAGFVTAGTYVDVLVTLDGGEAPTQTRTILQNIQALAAGQVIERDPEGKPYTVSVMTLLVNPDQAERLTLASNQGRIQLTLRGSLDAQETRTTGARMASLVEGPRPATAATARPVSVPTAPRERGTVVETYRGGVRTLNTF
jgi:pilus assembly protein CpaB